MWNRPDGLPRPWFGSRMPCSTPCYFLAVAPSAVPRLSADIDLKQIFGAIEICAHRVQEAGIVNMGGRKFSVNFTNLYYN